ncbi:MAG: hypothetical protein EP298_05225 [Gammaproteobacteria bacterium]|nr:MAG: hypothetical protein EP298_05225 [Gammaproteobacteria bacterium]UTW42474.1 hypothetical protein KFE69_13530 [bacterium SCSIO 12844]
MAQFLGNYVFSMEGNPFNIKLTNLEMRPASFFSETTWVAECSVLTLLLAMYMKKIKMIALPSLWLILILCFAVLSVTTTRAAYLALIIVCLYNIKIWNIKVLFSLWALCCLTAFALYMLSPEIFLSKLSYFMQRAQLHDLSAHGRYESIVLTFYGIAENIWVMLFGHGFVWSSVADATVSGAATGAKSFSLLLFIPYVFGVFGLLVFGLSLFEVFVRYQKLNVTDYSRVYGATILLAYLVISSVAPLFQYSLGVIWLALALCILYYGAKYDAS